MKKFIALLCTLCMIATMVPFSAFAVDATDVVATYTGGVLTGTWTKNVNGDYGDVAIDANWNAVNVKSDAVANVTVAMGGKVNDPYATFTAVTNETVLHPLANKNYTTRYMAMSINVYGQGLTEIFARLNNGNNKVSLFTEAKRANDRFSSMLTADRWNNVFFVFDSSNRDMKTYINGELKGSANMNNIITNVLGGSFNEDGSATTPNAAVKVSLLDLKDDFKWQLKNGSTSYVDDISIIHSDNEPQPHSYAEFTLTDATVSGNAIAIAEGKTTATINLTEGTKVAVNNGTAWADYTDSASVSAGNEVVVITSTPYGNIYSSPYTVDGTVGGAVNDNIDWYYAGGSLVITGTGDMPDYADHADLPWANYLSDIKSVEIGDGITKIGNRSFQTCNSMTECKIPSSVATIGDYAFNACSSLTSIVFPEGLTKIGGSVLHQCKNIKEITLPASIPMGLTTDFNNSEGSGDAFEIINAPDGSKALDWANNYKANASYTVTVNKTYPEHEWQDLAGNWFTWTYKDGALVIGKADNGTTGDIAHRGDVDFTNIPWNTAPYAYYNSLFTTVDVTDEITGIGRSTFAGLPNIVEVTLPGTVKDTKWGSFRNCNKLKRVVLEEGFETLGQDTFRYCSALEEVVLPNTVKQINGKIFNGISGNVELTIGNTALSGSQFGIGVFEAFKGTCSIKLPEVGGTTALNAVTAANNYAGTCTIKVIYPTAEGYISDTNKVENAFKWVADCSTGTFTITKTDVESNGKINGFANGLAPWYDYLRAGYYDKIVIGEGIKYLPGNIVRENGVVAHVTIPSTVQDNASYVFNAAKVSTLYIKDGANIPKLQFINDNSSIGRIILPATATPAKDFIRDFTFGSRGNMKAKSIEIVAPYNSPAYAWAEARKAEAAAMAPWVEEVKDDEGNVIETKTGDYCGIANDNFTLKKSYEITSFDNGTVTVANNTGYAVDSAYVIVAYYDNEDLDSLACAKLSSAQTLADAVNTVAVDAYAEADGKTVRVFLWNNFDDLKPMAAVFGE